MKSKINGSEMQQAAVLTSTLEYLLTIAGII